MPTAFLRSTLAILLALASLSLAPAPRPAQAAGTWYVATTGSDSNDCATPATPCATINTAIGKITSGDTIRIAVGVYTDGGDQVVLLDRSASLSGGWDEAFTARIGLATIDGQSARRGMTVGVGSV
ncbi:MAG: hypothetical protein JNK29_18060, partial [Anaerolineales bacterium]|nr:hypothetical protein [Anaerolineales bacterium]